MKLKQKIIWLIMTAMLISCIASPAYAAVTGGSVSQYGKAYFNNASGTPIALDLVTLNASGGMIAYALEPTLVSTRADATYDAYSETNAEFLKGVNIIMQYGYPMNEPALDENEAIKKDKARYATAVALAAWAVHCGASQSETLIDYVSNPAGLTAASTEDSATLEFCKDLMARALVQEEMPHSIVLNAEKIKLTKDGDKYKAKVKIDITNCGGGYSADISSLPNPSSNPSNVTGYTGKASEILEFIIPDVGTENEYSITFYGRDLRTNVHHQMYTSQSATDVSKLVAMTEDIEKATAEVVCQTTLILSKTEGSDSATEGGSETKVPESISDIPQSKGATYVILDGNIVLYEKDAATLTPIAGAEFEVKNANGQVAASGAAATTKENGAFSIEQLPNGKYTYTQKTTGNGYSIDPASYAFAVIATPNAKTYTGRVVTINDFVRVKVSVINGSGTGQAGATVSAYLSGSDTASATGETDASGVAELTKLPVGTYTLKVTKLKSGSTANAETKTVDITTSYANSDTPIALSISGKSDTTTKTQTGIAEVIAACTYIFPVSVSGLAAGGIYSTIKKSKKKETKAR